MEDKNKTFNYTYSAAQQEEIKHIRSKYAPPQESKMQQLRRLDRRVTQKAQAWSIALGVIGTLIMGSGMSLVMTQQSLFDGGAAMLLGIAVGLVGIVLLALAYPVYNRILKRERRRIAPEILRLSDELLK